MTHIHRITAGPLAGLVDFLWLARGYAPPHAAERVLPTGRMGLVLDLNAEARSAGLLAGARASAYVLDTARPLSLLGVSFRCGGGYPFFSVPAGSLQDLTEPLDTFWGHDAQGLRDQVLEASTDTMRFRIVERFLADRLRHATAPSPAVRFALQEFGRSTGPASVSDVVARTGWGARRFIADFRAQVGLAPKTYCRVMRFRRVIGEVSGLDSVDWTQTALSCGFYDQSHFIHEFRAFAGSSPSDYLRSRTASPNHVRLDR